jgi:2-dehydropantoate 2-reductase
MRRYRVAVFGAGAVGAYFGSRLAQGGEEVAFIARGGHLDAIRRHGLRVSGVSGDFVVHPAQVTDDPSAVGPVDAVLLGVKAWQVADVAEAIRPLIGPDSFVVPLQNGVEAPERLIRVLGADHAIGGLCRISAGIAAPGHIRHLGIEPYIAFGELDGHHSQRVERLQGAFKRSAGVTVEIPADIRVAMWQKFLFIATVSGLGALTRAPIGIVRSQPGTRQLLEAALLEVCTVAVAQGIALPVDVVQQTLSYIDSMPPDLTASMQRDIIEGRPSELDTQNGAVVRLAEQAGVPVPIHRLIYHTLLPLELRARGELQFRV